MIKIEDLDTNKGKIPALWKMFYIATSIGSITHELAHAFACYITKTNIERIVLFHIPKYYSDNLGYVKHDTVKGYMNYFLVNISPFFVGSFLSILFYLFFIKYHSYIPLWLGFFLLWLGFSFGVYALPSRNEFYEFDEQQDIVYEFYRDGIYLCRNESLLITRPISCFIKFIYSFDYKIRYKYPEVIYSFFLLLIAFIIGTTSSL